MRNSWDFPAASQLCSAELPHTACKQTQKQTHKPPAGHRQQDSGKIRLCAAMGDRYEIILIKPKSGYHNHKSYGRADTTRLGNKCPSKCCTSGTNARCDLSGPTQSTFGINSLRQKSKTHQEKFSSMLSPLCCSTGNGHGLMADFLTENHKLQQQEENKDNGAAISRTIHSCSISLLNLHQPRFHQFNVS